MAGLRPIEELFPQRPTRGPRQVSGERSEDANVADGLADLYATLAPAGRGGPPEPLREVLRRVLAGLSGREGRIIRAEPNTARAWLTEDELPGMSAGPRPGANGGRFRSSSSVEERSEDHHAGEVASNAAAYAAAHVVRRKETAPSCKDVLDQLDTESAQACIMVGD